MTVITSSTKNIEIEITQCKSAADLPLPSYATEGSSGLDLCANISSPITLSPMARELIPTGLSIALPIGFEAQVRPRSGLAVKHGITVLNTPGTIDSDYRGELRIILINLSKEDFTIERGMRIAQMVIQPVTKAILKPVQNLSNTQRGTGGFGSTGL
ncbi:MAG: dUTP diphosphatase [Rickettsiales bacterium]|nr:dUTP diphosphatase [Rickettsiales bacterium]